MIETFDTHSAQLLTTEKRQSGSVAGSASSAVVLANLPTGHARRIDILLKQTATGGGKGVQKVYLRSYSTGREFYFEKQINAGFTTSTHAITFGTAFSAATTDEAIGASVDILIDNGSDTNTVTVYAVARS